MSFNFRQIHRKIAPILFLPLFASALTGIFYRIGRSWFGIPNQLADFAMMIHLGGYLGPLVPVYVLLIGLGLLGLIVTGLSMTNLFGARSSKAAKVGVDALRLAVRHRKLHHILAPIFFLPLAVSAVTGIIFLLGKDFFGMSGEVAGIFLQIHQGTYLGPILRPFYVLLIGLGLIGLLVTGINMTSIFRQRRV